jgi:predicted nucleic acid-binding protein
MLDANILISAIFNPDGTPNRAYIKASEPPHTIVLCDQIIDETRRIFNSKFPARIPAMERFFAVMRCDLVTLTAEDAVNSDEGEIRDGGDNSVVRGS